MNLSWYAGWNPDTKNYYAQASKYFKEGNGKQKQKTYYLHKEIMNAKEDEVVDHVYHNTLDNRKNNLIVVNKHKNDINRKGANSNTTSGERNVSWHKKAQEWLVQLQVNKQNICFGRFKKDDLDKAIQLARDLRKDIYDKIYNIEEIQELKNKYKNNLNG